MTVYKFAGFWRRLVAYVIDSVIINIIFLALLLVVTFALFAGTSDGENDIRFSALMNQESLSLLGLVLISFYVVLSIVYFTYFHGINGRTPGKMLLGLQVLSTGGTEIGFGISFLRAVGYLVSSIFCIGFIWAAFDRKKQSWHDKIAATVVIIRPQESPTAGLTVSELQTAPGVARQPDGQDEEAGPDVAQLLAANEDGNGGTVKHEGAAGQKIP
jgi:uncharacterized RDD family membrane protein YckC